MSNHKTSWADYCRQRREALPDESPKGSVGTASRSSFDSINLVARVTDAVKNKQEFVVHPQNPYVTLPLSVVYSALDEEVPREIGSSWEDYFREQVEMRDCECDGPYSPECTSSAPSQQVNVETMNFTVNIDFDDNDMESLVDLVSQTGDECDCSGWVFV